MTKRDYYDLLLQTSLSGGFPAVEHVDGRTECRYRTSDGKKCAFGLLIPDERYQRHMEGPAVWAVVNDFGLHDVIPVGMEVGEAQEAQGVHDRYTRELYSAGPTQQHPWSHDAFVARLNALPFFAEYA